MKKLAKIISGAMSLILTVCTVSNTAPLPLYEQPLAVASEVPGDLLFYGTPATARKPMVVAHVAMYYGDRKIIHSSQMIRISSLTPDGEDYYEREPLAVRRVLGHVDTGEGIRSVAARPWYY